MFGPDLNPNAQTGSESDCPDWIRINLPGPGFTTLAAAEKGWEISKLDTDDSINILIVYKFSMYKLTYN